MRPDAIAKSYRPNKAVFVKDQFPCVGAGAPGELYFRATLIHLPRLKQHIARAEDYGEVKTSKDTGSSYHYVTRARSEVSAIDTIEIAPSERKWRFPADAAVAILSDTRVASGYIVELFESEPLRASAAQDALGFRTAVITLQDILLEAGAGLVAAFLPNPGGNPSIEFLLTTSSNPPLIDDRRLLSAERLPRTTSLQLDMDARRHDKVLRKLAQHPLVRRIRLPICIEPTIVNVDLVPQKFPSIGRLADARYPKVGVIDTGVDGPLRAWVLSRHDFLDAGDCDPKHGSMVAGILVAARGANNPQIGSEEDGCDIIDLPLMPVKPFLQVYGGRGFEAFLEELEAAIAEAKDRFGVRIFNMSLNLIASVDSDNYSIYAARLDEIQDRLQVLIVNSAGNLPWTEWRAPWPKGPMKALAALAQRPMSDAIYMPSESVRSVAVGALNPPGSSHVTGTPATYSRRGPGLKVGVKPDVAHFGGTGDSTIPKITHLVSSDEAGNSVHVRGTSFAAPLVAKTLAVLDIATGERLAPRSLRAFLIHHSSVPAPLSSPRLRQVSRQFVGFGQPSGSVSMLETDDHAITMLFESRLTAGLSRPAILRFGFQWPSALVDTVSRACRGIVRMTLAYDPPIDQAFGTEFVRVNLSAHLRQRQPLDRKDGTPSFHDRVSQAFLPRTSGLTIPERTLIDHGLKWWPTKRYEADLSEGVGNSTEWRLEVESMVRAEATFPAEGVPFSLILTIEDDRGAAPIFQSVRQQLLANKVDIQAIQTALRVRARG